MNSAVSTPSRSVRTGLLVGALLGTALVFYTTAPWGPAVNELALHHFTAAEGLRTGTGMTLSRGEPFVMWPPLMPVLLALAHSLGLEYPTAGMLFNLVAHTATLFLSSLLLWRLFGSVIVAFACQVVLLVSPELLRSGSTIQTEPLFFALVLAGLYSFVLYLERPTRQRLAVTTVIAILTCLQRYTGVALVISVFLVMLWFPRAMSVRARFGRGVVYSVVGMLPLVLWMLRNRSVNQTWGVIPEPAHVTLQDNVMATLRALSRFLTLDTAIDQPLGLFDISSNLVALGLAVVAYAQLVRARIESERRAWCIYLTFSPVYLAVLIGVSSYVALDPIGNRYVIPVYPFLWGTLFLGFRAVHKRLADVPSWLGWSVRSAILTLFAAHLVLAADRTRGFVVHAREEGVGGFTTRAWQRSPVVEWLRTNRLDGEIYSNLPEIVIFALGRRATFVQSGTLEEVLEHASKGAHIVWMDRYPGPTPFPKLSPTARALTRIARVEGALVYEVAP